MKFRAWLVTWAMVLAIPALGWSGARKIVVIPFKNATGDTNLDWLGERIAGSIQEKIAGSTPSMFTLPTPGMRCRGAMIF